MLELSAKLPRGGKFTSEINVFVNDRLVGRLAIKAEHADELVGLLNAAGETQRALCGLLTSGVLCELRDKSDELMLPELGIDHQRVKYVVMRVDRAAWVAARAALAKAEPTT